MSASEAARLATWAASRAHVAKNAFQADAGLMNLAAAVERLAQAVAELADHTTTLSAVAEAGDEAGEEQPDDAPNGEEGVSVATASSTENGSRPAAGAAPD